MSALPPDSPRHSEGAAKDSSFYTNRQLEQRLELVQHLVEYSNQLIALTGEAGAGKTTFLDQIALRAPPSWILARLSGRERLSEAELLEWLVRHFSTSGADNTAPQATRIGLHQCLAAVEAHKQVPLGLVDDAHLMERERLRLLVSLAHPPTGDHRLHVMLAGDPSLPDLLHGLNAQTAGGAAVIHVIDLPALNAEQTRDFLRHAGTGGTRALPANLTAQMVEDIHATSAGLPGRILSAAAARVRPRARDTGADPARRWLARHWRWAAAAALAAGIATLVVLYRGGGEQPVVVDLALPELSQTPQATAPREPPPARAAAVEAQRPAEQRSPAAARASREPMRSRERTAEGSSGATPAGTTGSEAQPRPPAAPEANPHPARSAPPPPARGPEWLQAQAPDQFVVQLFAAHDRAAVFEYLDTLDAETGLGGKTLSWFATTHQGRPWYVVCYGLYPSRDAAHAAIATLPAELRRSQPWVRSLAGIRQAIAAAPPP